MLKDIPFVGVPNRNKYSYTKIKKRVTTFVSTCVRLIISKMQKGEFTSTSSMLGCYGYEIYYVHSDFPYVLHSM